MFLQYYHNSYHNATNDKNLCVDFSGGQIDNTVRKAMMEEIVKGEKPTMATLETLCSEEQIAYKSSKKVGFC